MKRKVYLPWDAAGWRSRTYTPRVTKVHGPVGKSTIELLLDARATGLDMNTLRWNSSESAPKCNDCGHHVCSCERHCKVCGVFGCVVLHKAPQDAPKPLTRSQLLERAGYVAVPVPAEPTLCDAPVCHAPMQGPRYCKGCGAELVDYWYHRCPQPTIVPPSPGPAGPTMTDRQWGPWELPQTVAGKMDVVNSLFGINADPAAPSWKAMKPSVLTREMSERFWDVQDDRRER